MTGAVASTTTATAPRERGWRWYLVAMAAMLVVSASPFWPPALALLAAIIRLALPVEQFVLLVLLALAACAIVGWWAGGRLSVALLWVTVSALALWRLPMPITGYGAFVRGYAMALGAAFGLVCLATGARPFLGRALASVALSALVSLIGLVGRTPSGTGVLAQSVHMLETDYRHRLDESMSSWRRRTDSAMWQVFSKRFPDVADRADRVASTIARLGGSDGGQAGPDAQASGALDGRVQFPLVRLAPALLGLESLLALALGWVTYHRLSRTRIGPPLSAVRDVRFNDQLVWGLVVAGVILLLPTLADWQIAGVNLVCFLGALYALRGVGVLMWWVPDRAAVLLLLAIVVLVPLLGPAQVLTTIVVTMFGLGLVDTWRDFRAVARARRPESHP